MPRYPLIHRLLHWLIAVIVAGMLALGLTFMVLGFDGVLATFGQDTTNLLYKYHKSFGIVVLCLMLLRLAVRFSFGKPSYCPPLSPIERGVSRAVHSSLYALLIAMPLIGWAATAAGGFPIEFFRWTLPGFLDKDPDLSRRLYVAHGTVGIVILLLVGLHIAGALRHWLIKRDEVITRMTLP